MSYSVIVVDEELASCQAIRGQVAQDTGLQVIAEATTGPEAVAALLQHRPHVVFISLPLPHLDGFGVLKGIWMHFQPYVVFLTCPNEPAYQPLEESGVPCLPKPFTELQFQQTLRRVKTTLTQQQPQAEVHTLMRQLLSEEPAPQRTYLKRMLVKENHKLFFIKVDDILYFDADGNYITLHTLKRNYTIYESLTQLEQRLDPADFTRINRSYIVNLNHIEELESYFNGEYLVRMIGGHCLKWTRFYRDNVKAFLSKET
jgi:two-component system LytT family response regulator